ncbi:MAG: HEAT repeat domain-containing protein [Candidatus Omnitrophica bacterium]|nr:HEAT repeat domain-containing protein [Candidatus Omnitrophota bacterium]
MRKKIILISVLIIVILAVTAVKTNLNNKPKVENRYSNMLVAGKAVEALGRIGSLRAYDVLIKAAASKDYFVRAYAAQGLGKLSDTRSIPLLQKLTSDNNYYVRVCAAVSLVQLGQAEVKIMLFSLLQDDRPIIRSITVGEVGKLGKDFLFALTELLSKEQDSAVRVNIIEQLGNYQFNPALSLLRAALKDENAGVRSVACSAIAQIRDNESIPQLLKILDSEDNPSVRAAVKNSLSQLNDNSRLELFWKELDEKNPLLKASSFTSLANLGEVGILPILLEELVAPVNSTIVRIGAARALDILRPRVVRLLSSALEEAEILYKVPLCDNLQFDYQIGGSDLMLLVTQALNEKKHYLYNDAPFILSALNNRIALPALRETLLKDDQELAALAAFVLGNFEDQDAVDELIEVFYKYGM